MQSNATQFAGIAEHSNSPLKMYTLLAKGSAKGSADLVQQDFDAIEDAGFNDPLRQGRDLPPAKRELTSESLQIRPLERSSTKPYDNSFFHGLFGY